MKKLAIATVALGLGFLAVAGSAALAQTPSNPCQGITIKDPAEYNAYTNAISNILEWDMPKHAVYLWTLPMFHCNGWCFPWTVAARAGVNVCLRKVDAQAIFDLIRNERDRKSVA